MNECNELNREREREIEENVKGDEDEWVRRERERGWWEGKERLLCKEDRDITSV